MMFWGVPVPFVFKSNVEPCHPLATSLWDDGCEAHCMFATRVPTGGSSPQCT
jgi:hypothetical protein